MFCSKKRTLCSLIILLVLALAGCTRAQKPAVERLAVVAFENLSSDPNLNWTGRAVASALVYDLAPSSAIHAQMVDSVAGAFVFKASRIVQGYLSERNGRLRMAATIEDPGRVRTVSSFEFAGPVSEGVVPLLNQFAKRLDYSARPFGTAKAAAFRDFGEALTAHDPPAILERLDSATAADPHFAAAYLASARLLLAQGQRDQGLEQLAAARAAHPDAIDAAEIEFVSASVAGGLDGRAKTLEVLTHLTPADPNRFRELADLKLAQRQFQEAAKGFEAAARVAPDQPELWNQMGYAYSFAGDLGNARRALEHYGELLGSGNANALDSLGEVNFYSGDFAQAEKYFLAAQAKNPARGGEELIKAAQARLMAGDLAGADTNFQKYLGLVQPAQRKTAGFEQAQWDFLTGRRKQGMARLEQLIPSLEGEQQSLALSQLSIWKLETGATAAAAELAVRAEALARSGRTRNAAAMCRLIAAQPGKPSGSRLVDAYALLFARKYAEAIPLLETVYRETSPTGDWQIRTLLGWAQVETGHVEEARKLVELYPLPLTSGDPLFASLGFPRFLFLRGRVGKDTKKSYELYLKYAGDVADIFGDEAVAKKGLSGG